MVYPDPARRETAAFHASTSPLFGGGITNVSFNRGRYEYRVYSKVGRSDGGSSPQERTPEFEDGILIFQDGKQRLHPKRDVGSLYHPFALASCVRIWRAFSAARPESSSSTVTCPIFLPARACDFPYRCR